MNQIHSLILTSKFPDRFVAICVFLVISAGSSMAGDDVKGGRTWDYWNSFNQHAVDGFGVEALGTPAWKGKPDDNINCTVLEDIIAGERARARAITRLSVLDVDPDLGAYASDFVKSRLELANVLTDYENLVKKQMAITSPSVLGVGLLFNLLNHSDDHQAGLLWRSLLDEGRQTAENLNNLQQPAMACQARALAARELTTILAAREIIVRVKLSERYGREFPPMQTYVRTTTGKDSERVLSDRRIMQNMLGKSIGSPFNTWTFESMKEFHSFKVISVKYPTNVRTEYEVETQVRGLHTGQQHFFKLHLTYGWICTRWFLVGIQETN